MLNLLISIVLNKSMNRSAQLRKTISKTLRCCEERDGLVSIIVFYDHPMKNWMRMLHTDDIGTNKYFRNAHGDGLLTPSLKYTVLPVLTTIF